MSERTRRLDELLREEISTTARPGRVTSVARLEQAARGGLTDFVEK